MLPSEEIKEKINIVDLIGEYVQLKKAGTNYRALCPFHQEKTPSFMISPAKQIWHCFGCGLGGDAFEFIKQVEGVDFSEALRILAPRAGIVLRQQSIEYKQDADHRGVLFEINEIAAKYFVETLVASSEARVARDYLQNRGFKPDTVKTWQLGYCSADYHAFENFIVKRGFQKKEAVDAGLLVEKEGNFFDRFRERIMFPLFDAHGRVVGFTGRILREMEGVAKYVNSPETSIYSKSRVIYGLHLAKTEIRKKDEVIIVEGNVDVITCHEFGYKNVVCSSGTALTESQLSSLKRFTNNVKFAFDVDQAGMVATRRAVELALVMGFDVKIINIPSFQAKDPDELIRREISVWEKQVNEAKNFLDFYFEAVFAKIDLNSSTEKKQAASQLLPLVSLLPDPIERSHFASLLALKLGVEEEIIFDILKNHQKGQSNTTAGIPSPQKAAVNRKTRQELIERRVLGFLLKFSDNLKTEWESLGEDIFTVPVLREIFRNTLLQIKSEAFDLEKLRSESPKLAQEVELLIFALENELSLTDDWNLENLKRNFLTQLREEGLKRKMRELSIKIKQAEQAGNKDEIKILSSEFVGLTQELSKLTE